MSKSFRIKKNGPAMKFWVIVNPILAVIFCVLVFITNHRIRVNYNQLSIAMNDYSECNKAIQNFKEASDYLTDQVRFFVLTNEPVFIESFFYEAEELNRRKIAIDVVEMSHIDDEIDMNLLVAMRETQKLNYLEYYAMKLVCEAKNMSPAEIPETLRNIVLSDEDKTLTSVQKLHKAQSLVYNYDYLSSKSRIMNFANASSTSLANAFVEKQNEVNKNTKYLFLMQKIYVVILVVLVTLFCIFLLVFVLIPIGKAVICIEKGEKMKLIGASEVQYIAKAYNALCDKNMITASVLKHKAEHDPLTGLINREAFDQIKKAYLDSEEPIAFLIIDIDLFKNINDTYGHLVGDDVLRKISELLMEHFRNTDYVARIGGDEFAVIMTKFGDDPRTVISKKISNLNQNMQNVSDGLPSVSLSVGVSISNCGYRYELQQQADEALYRVKNGGRCNCSFY